MKNIEKKLNIYAKEGYNVLLTGKHGVGKTAMIKSVFEELFGPLGVNWMYFSASTLDPWVDFIGIPKNYTKEDGTEVFKLVPPEHLAENNEIRAIFFDEINRAEEKTLNAIMELIQFKSINGRKFENLSCVWAAENPADDKDEVYSVKPLDPAQKDRFQIQIEVPSILNKEYFLTRYDSNVFDVSRSWWNKNSKSISPRKLDDILGGFMKGYDLTDFTTEKSVKELSDSLSAIQELQEIISVVDNSSDEDLSRTFGLDKIRKLEKVLPLDKDQKILQRVYPLVDEETRAYIKKTHKFKIGMTLTDSAFSDVQKTFIEEQERKDPIEFSQNNYTELLNYMKGFNTAFKKLDESVNYHPVVNDAFPYFFVDTFKTPGIRAFISSVDHAEIKMWFVKSMYMLSSSTSVLKPVDIQKTPLFLVLLRLSGNSDFCRKMNINKIFFNKWKKDFPHNDFSEYTKRLFTK